MKTPRILIVLLVSAFSLSLSLQASAQPSVSDSSGGLTVSADTFSIVKKDSPKLHVIIQLLNTTNHDITVLTKTGHSHYFNLSADKTKFRFWFDFDAGYRWLGHQVVPSLPEYAPVTLKPGEVALCMMDVEQNGSSKTLDGLLEWPDRHETLS
jgi:hypothetical protein